MRILLTGGTGFLGRPVALALSRAGHEVALVVYPGESTPPPQGSGIRVLYIDLSDKDDRRLIAEAKADTLLQMAWYAAPNDFWRSPKNLDWVAISLDVARHFREAGGRRIIGVGTGAEYDWSSGGVMDEVASAIHPATLYGVCKSATREILSAYACETGMSMAWARVFWPYGPGEPPGRLISSLGAALARGEHFICRSANLLRDYIFVEDVADALTALVGSSVEGIINIGSGTAVSLGDLAKRFALLAGRSELLTLETIRSAPDNPEMIVAATHRLSKELCWIPKIDLEKGLLQTWVYWKNITQRGMSNKKGNEHM